MILLNLILSIQVILYLLLGTALYIPGKLPEIPFKSYFNRTQVPPTTTTTTTEATTTTTAAPLNYCTTTCGTCGSVTASGGIVNSLNYPVALYMFVGSCVYTIQVPTNKKIQLSFTAFSLSVLEKITIDGTTTGTLYLGGISLTTPQSSITSISNSLIITFTAIAPGPGSKWQATYTVV